MRVYIPECYLDKAIVKRCIALASVDDIYEIEKAVNFTGSVGKLTESRSTQLVAFVDDPKREYHKRSNDTYKALSLVTDFKFGVCIKQVPEKFACLVELESTAEEWLRNFFEESLFAKHGIRLDLEALKRSSATHEYASLHNFLDDGLRNTVGGNYLLNALIDPKPVLSKKRK
ncbi:MAG: hypothetical protein SFY70_00930 [Bacteroidia bacterium]|nr:hypothetical protein [Bacteroidia bacterium]